MTHDIYENPLVGRYSSREMQQLKMDKTSAILSAAEKEIMTITPAAALPPREAIIRSSLRCAQCNEKFMESRSRQKDGKTVCIPCSEAR